MKKIPSIGPIISDIVLITIGSLVFAVGAEAILVHQKFIIGGLYGTGMLIYFESQTLSPGLWYLLLNLPLLLFGWIYLSKRFFYYSLYGVIILTVFTELLDINYPIHEQLYAAVAGGVICGIGGGIILRSRGSGGGLDIIAIILNEKFNLGIGKFYMIYNTILYAIVINQYEPDIVIASIILTFISSLALEQVLTLFNQRKIVYIISDMQEEVTNAIMGDLHQGATLLEARGAYSGKKKQIIMTITNNLQVKRLEDKVFNTDPDAFFIVENSFNVIGSGFSKRRIY